MLLTLRGIPQIYYGTEILMKNFKNPTDAEVRSDFPGGFPVIKQISLPLKEVKEQENETFNYVKPLANFRKTSSALTPGKTMQFFRRRCVCIFQVR